jgi:prepilin-type N-terminal cleavage/methylation domain-containing protein
MAWKTRQMISAVKTTKSPRGFTLIEIVMVLAIAAIIMGGAVGMMVFSSDEHALRNASGEIEVLAKRARTIAMLHQTPYALEFREGVVRLLPLAQAGNIERRTAGGRRVGGEPVEQAGEHQQYVLEGGMKVLVRRWDSLEWLPAVKDSIHVWRFDPTGLCEPISVRLVLDKSWSEDTYHPLTASVRNSQLEAR